MEFTKEQLIASAHARIEFAEMMLAGELEPLKERTWSIELELARRALASLEAEAVAYVDPFAFNNFSVYRAGDTDNKRMGREWMWANPDAGLIPVYTAPPVPVAVMDEAQSRELFEKNCMANTERNKWHPDLYAHLPAREQWAAWEACRAAMLQSFGNSEQLKPVSPRYKLPDGYVAVPIEPTTNQWAAGMQAFDSGMDKVTRVYKAMLAAAPQLEVK